MKDSKWVNIRLAYLSNYSSLPKYLLSTFQPRQSSSPCAVMTERHKLLLLSPSLQEENAPRISFKTSGAGYILSIAPLPGFYAASTSAPSNVIDLFDKSTLQGVQTLSGHVEATTSLRTVDTIAGTTQKSLVSSGKDGRVKVWDQRSNTATIQSEKDP